MEPDNSALGVEISRAFGPLGAYMHAGIKRLQLVETDIALEDFFREFLAFYIRSSTRALV